MKEEHNKEYNSGAKMFHWFVVGLLAIQFAVAWIMPDVRGDKGPELLVSIHMSFGLIVLFVMALRLLWRWKHPAPPLPEGLAWWQNIASHFTHYLLYILLIILPFTGWVWASARGWQINIFNLVNLPPLVAVDLSFAKTIGFVHSTLAAAIPLLIGLHILAALYHHLVLKDGIMARMLPKRFILKKENTVE